MSGLDFQIVDVRFEQGLDTHTQDKLKIPGKWEELKNLTLTNDDTPQRREGILSMVAGTTNALATHNSELLTISGRTVKSVSTANNTNQAITQAGSVGLVNVAAAPLIRNTNIQASPDVAYGNGYTCSVWTNISESDATIGVNVMLVDEVTGAHVIPNTELRASATVFCPRVVFVTDSVNGNAFYIFYIDGTSICCRPRNADGSNARGAVVPSKGKDCNGVCSCWAARIYISIGKTGRGDERGFCLENGWRTNQN